MSVEPSYNTFLTDKEDLPRLSILSNYKSIMRVMNKHHNDGQEFDRRFKKQVEPEKDYH